MKRSLEKTEKVVEKAIQRVKKTGKPVVVARQKPEAAEKKTRNRISGKDAMAALKGIDSDLTSPLPAIRAKCLDCCGGAYTEVTLCTAEQCPLWAFRLGKNPFRKPKVMSDEQRENAATRLAAARKAKGK